MSKVSLPSLLLGFFLLATVSCSSHQPRIVSEEMTQIENPEVSQAFYAELKGKSDYYQIESEEPFKLYVGILVPDLGEGRVCLPGGPVSLHVGGSILIDIYPSLQTVCP